MNTKRVDLQDLKTNDSFRFPGRPSIFVVESKRTEGHLTSVVYRPFGDYSPAARTELVRVNLTSVERVVLDIAGK